ncbi:MAG: GNAT family protein [Bacteroidota bacterium]|nr:GNAT family protein [Bacteroidota bacterium]
MKKITFLTGEKIYLRPFEENDINLVQYGKNNPLVRETLFLFAPVTQKQIQQEMLSWSESKEIVLFTICRKEDDAPVGQIAFVRIDYVSRAAVFYIAIYDDDSWSQGYGKEATSLMVEYGFDILNLNRIQLHVALENEKGIKAYKKAGFVIEGTLREAMYHHDRYVDFYVMGILRKEFYGNKEQ